MKSKIEDYRGFEISFDTEKEVFYCMSSSYDTETTKKSFAAVKNWIDAYIKDNQEFRPFKLMRFGNEFDDAGEITITGVRKDGKFTYLDKQGKLQQLSEYNERDWFIPKPENEPIIAQIKEIYKQEKALMDKRNALEKTLNKVDFKSVRHLYLPQ